MSTKKQAAPTDPEFFPENVEFLGFIGGWDCYIGIDTVHNLFYLIRTSDLDWLEVVVKSSNEIISRKCVMSIPRRSSKREARNRELFLRNREFLRGNREYHMPKRNHRRMRFLVHTGINRSMSALGH
jgi:hypothetical protein